MSAACPVSNTCADAVQDNEQAAKIMKFAAIFLSTGGPGSATIDPGSLSASPRFSKKLHDLHDHHRRKRQREHQAVLPRGVRRFRHSIHRLHSSALGYHIPGIRNVESVPIVGNRHPIGCRGEKRGITKAVSPGKDGNMRIGYACLALGVPGSELKT
jgi:hypothetical protein